MAILPQRSVRPSKPAKTPREEAKTRIIASYRRKILRLFPQAQFDEAVVLGCSAEEFIEEIQTKLRLGMTWENYGTVWCVANYEKLDAKFLTTNPEAFYSYFNHVSFEPKMLEELGGKLGNLYRKAKPRGVNMTPGQPSKFDVAPGEVPSFEPDTNED